MSPPPGHHPPHQLSQSANHIHTLEETLEYQITHSNTAIGNVYELKVFFFWNMVDATRRATLHKGLALVNPADVEGGLIILEHAAGAISSMTSYATASQLQNVAKMDLLALCDASPHAISAALKTMDALVKKQNPAAECACGGESKIFGDVSEYEHVDALAESFVAERQFNGDVMTYNMYSPEKSAEFFTTLATPTGPSECHHSVVFGKKYKFSKVPTTTPFCPANVEIWVIRAMPQDSEFVSKEVMKRDHVDVVVDLLSVCSTHNPVGYLHQLTHVFQTTTPNKYKLLLLEHGFSREVPYMQTQSRMVTFAQHRVALACAPCLNFPIIFKSMQEEYKWVKNASSGTCRELLLEVFPPPTTTTTAAAGSGDAVETQTKKTITTTYTNAYNDKTAPHSVPHFFYFIGDVDNSPAQVDNEEEESCVSQQACK